MRNISSPLSGLVSPFGAGALVTPPTVDVAPTIAPLTAPAPSGVLKTITAGSYTGAIPATLTVSQAHYIGGLLRSTALTYMPLMELGFEEEGETYVAQETCSELGGGSVTTTMLDTTIAWTVPVASDLVGNQSFTENVAITPVDVAGDFGNPYGVTYTVQSGTLTVGLALDANTGVISGTPTTTQVNGALVIRGTNGNGDFDDSTFNLEVLVAVTSAMEADASGLHWYRMEDATVVAGEVTAITDNKGSADLALAGAINGPVDNTTYMSFAGAEGLRSSAAGAMKLALTSGNNVVAFVVAKFVKADWVTHNQVNNTLFAENNSTSSSEATGIEMAYTGGGGGLATPQVQSRHTTSNIFKVSSTITWDTLVVLEYVIDADTDVEVFEDTISLGSVASISTSYHPVADAISIGGRISDAGAAHTNALAGTDIYEIYLTTDDSVLNLDAIRSELTAKHLGAPPVDAPTTGAFLDYTGAEGSPPHTITFADGFGGGAVPNDGWTIDVPWITDNGDGTGTIDDVEATLRVATITATNASGTADTPINVTITEAPAAAALKIVVDAVNNNLTPAVYTFRVEETAAYWDETSDMQDWDIHWDFDDVGSTYTNWDADMKSTNQREWALGNQVGHTYETAGTKTVTMTVNRPGLSEVILTTDVVVLDREATIAWDEVIAWSTTDFVGKTAGATEVATMAALITRLSANNSSANVKVEFRAGESFDIIDNMGSTATNVYYTSFGSGATPILQPNEVTRGNDVWTDGTLLKINNGGKYITFEGVAFDGGYNAVTGELTRGNTIAINTFEADMRIAVHKCDFAGMNMAVYLGSGSSLGFSDSTIIDFTNYGLFSQAPNGLAQGLGNITVYGGWNKQHIDAESIDGKGLSQQFDTPDHGPMRFANTHHTAVHQCAARSMTGWSGNSGSGIRVSQPWLRAMTDDVLGEEKLKTLNVWDVYANSQLVASPQNSGTASRAPLIGSVEALYGVSLEKDNRYGEMELGGLSWRNCIFERLDVVWYHPDLSPAGYEGSPHYGCIYYVIKDDANLPATAIWDRPIRTMCCTFVNFVSSGTQNDYEGLNYENVFPIAGKQPWSDVTNTNNIEYVPNVPNAASFINPTPLDIDANYRVMAASSGYQTATGTFDNKQMPYRDFTGTIRPTTNMSKGANEPAALGAGTNPTSSV